MGIAACVWSVCFLVSLTLGQTKAQSQTNFTRPVFKCGGNLVTDAALVASEGFPNYYRPNSKCAWYITVPEGHVVMMSFRFFDMEADPTCRYDYLDVYNGHSRVVQKLGRFCGTFRPGALISTSNTMMLEMVTDGSTGGRGFVAYFSGGKPHVEENQFCGGRLTKPQGSVQTPNWPNADYPAGISCSWHISVEPSNVIEVKFQKLDLEPDMYCRYDYVALFNGGERDDTRRIGRYCGGNVPGTIVTKGNELLLQFVSDLSVTSDGFMVHYSSVPRGSRSPTATGDVIYGPQTGLSLPQTTLAPGRPTQPKVMARLKPTLRPTIRIPIKPPPRKPTPKPKPTLKTKPKPKPTLKTKPTPKPKPTLKTKPTPKPKPTFKTKPTPKPKPTLKTKPTKFTPKASVNKLKATLKPKLKPTPKSRPMAKPTHKPVVKLISKPKIKPTLKPKIKPQTTAKAKVIKTVTKKPVVSKKPLPLNPLCTQACKRTGTLQSNFCPSDFVITGKVTLLTPGLRGGVTVELSLIKAYKAGRLNIVKSGPAMSVKLTSTCKRCPGLTKGLNYVLMGNVDAQGNGLLSPSSFALLYKPIHAKPLANLARQSC